MKPFFIAILVFSCIELFAGNNCLYDRNKRKVSEKRVARQQYYLNYEPEPKNNSEKQQNEEKPEIDEDFDDEDED